jgi:hypothetical protein
MKSVRPILALLLALGSMAGPAAAADKKEKKPLADQFTGTLVTVTGPTSRGLGDPVTIWIDAYTTDEVAQSLKTTLAEKGQIGLRDALQNLSAGRIRVGENTSTRLSVARQRVGSDGRVILLATNTPLTNFQIQQGLRTQDYPVTFIEIKLKADGTGEGTVVGMAQVSIDENKNLAVASLGTQPSSLTNVQTVAKKK